MMMCIRSASGLKAVINLLTISPLMRIKQQKTKKKSFIALGFTFLLANSVWFELSFFSA